jgi:hypothetical protein
VNNDLNLKLDFQVLTAQGGRIWLRRRSLKRIFSPYLQQVLYVDYCNVQVDDILGSPATVDQGGVYHISERGDRLIDLSAFRDLLWQV